MTNLETTVFNLTGQLWGMPVNFTGNIAASIASDTGDTITKWMPIIIAFGSLIAIIILTLKQISIMKKQADIQEKQTVISDQQLEIAERQFELIQSREEERLSNLRKANLKFKLANGTNGAYQELIITNEGPSEARNIEIKLDSRALNECLFPIRPANNIERLIPNTSYKYDLYAGTGVPLPIQIALYWSDDFSNHRELEGALSRS